MAEATPAPKLLNPQPRVDGGAIRERFHVAKSYVELTRALVAVGFPKRSKSLGSDVETLMVLLAVFIGDAEGRPMSATKISNFASIPRPTVHRRLEKLISMHKIVRKGRMYHYAKDAMIPDPANQITKAVTELCNTPGVFKMDAN